MRPAAGAHNIATGVYYPTPIHRLAPYADTAPRHGWDLPHTEAAAGQVLALPVHPGLTTDDLHRIANAADAAVPAHEHGRPAAPAARTGAHR
ncbi:DegT/DnrJ/EryC1/StrS family aminotransferase [Kitasatospora indigofera]|uniref:DegT/DnrJ/EryC1/StrS family aminotransferase n=1 Tax=Kitasatospora indigofera TaxID=67307 RepID=UPI0036868DBD